MHLWEYCILSYWQFMHHLTCYINQSNMHPHSSQNWTLSPYWKPHLFHLLNNVRYFYHIFQTVFIRKGIENTIEKIWESIIDDSSGCAKYLDDIILSKRLWHYYLYCFNVQLPLNIMKYGQQPKRNTSSHVSSKMGP